MAANTPIRVRPSAICTGVFARLVNIELAPMPTKKMTIMPSRLHRSASQPAGMAQTPSPTKAGVAVRDEFPVAHPPFTGESQRRYRGKDENEKVIQEMANVEERNLTWLRCIARALA